VELSLILQRICLVIACLAGPILWGIVVNWMFDFLQSRKADQPEKTDDDPVFPDYQI
jgi:hypothetical protein